MTTSIFLDEILASKQSKFLEKPLRSQVGAAKPEPMMMQQRYLFVERLRWPKGPEHRNQISNHALRG